MYIIIIIIIITAVTNRGYYWGENEHLEGPTPYHAPFKTTNY